jgi:hypothetical protein
MHHDVEPNDGLKKYLSDLIQLQLVDGNTTHGRITKLVIDNGEESLSDEQRRVFEKYVLVPFGRKECSVHGELIEWEEMISAIDYHEDTGKWMCPYHQDQAEKAD